MSPEAISGTNHELTRLIGKYFTMDLTDNKNFDPAVFDTAAANIGNTTQNTLEIKHSLKFIVFGEGQMYCFSEKQNHFDVYRAIKQMGEINEATCAGTIHVYVENKGGTFRFISSSSSTLDENNILLFDDSDKFFNTKLKKALSPKYFKHL